MRKKGLPDSLELLLDTMCNTFGGIMFIAISLIVMSQLITQQQKAMTQEEITKKVIEDLKRKIDAVHAENMQLSKKALNVDINTGNVPKEKKDAVIRLKSAKEKNLQLENSIERLETKLRMGREKQKHLAEMEKTLTEELNRKKVKFHAEKELLLQKKNSLAKRIRSLEETLKNLQPRTLRFTRAKPTTKRPYWVLLQNNRIYRFGNEGNPLAGEVEAKFSEVSSTVWLKTVKGTEIGGASESVLAYLFKDVDKEAYFINILTDVESFSTLMVTRQFLRNNNFLNNWSVNPDFVLSVGRNVSHSASE